MSISLADFYKIDEDLFEASGAFDPILNIDTRLFIDPALLRGVSTEELKGSEGRLKEYFTSVLQVVGKIEKPGDALWRAATDS